MIRQLKAVIAFLRIALAFCAPAAPASGQAASGFTLITGAQIYVTLLGQLLPAGRIVFTSVNSTGQPISFRVGETGGGQIVSRPFAWPIVAGVITADSSGIAPQR